MFRVNYRTGEMSICYVQLQKEAVVCTAQANPAARAPTRPRHRRRAGPRGPERHAAPGRRP